MKCPTCEKEIEYAGNSYRPFCSERCKLIDLGRWAGGEYRVPTTEHPPDEVVGQMITFGLAAGRYQLSAFYVALGFGLFRFFDILKPFPIRDLERIKGGVGVIADDVGAGFYALAILTLIRYVFVKS